ncbi:alpha/beta fold hydrolase [Solimicrobium silvestre]|uniref:Putative hydrolases or acyltransferases (Alpha/beta hydrolase superfamily) n=1 Tax=Solimicrobium silvestre TaxID=2099400 RepID=A0A2S9GVH6_9BURK|nr:alpha/beta hydrolase [Solimicrobium silvestre]PRC91666.1 putative hydrolases or acyltransferases (alpha/beta hydrolase superfamily) [Solimicrobium silvestre]
MIYQVQGNPVYCYTGGKAFQAELATLVFIHGAQNDHSVWALQSRYLAHHGYNVLAVDLPGHGRSAGNALTSIEDMATWLLALLDVAGVVGEAKASLIGHSMGSLIALETARCAPDRVTKLALLGNAYPMKVADALLTMARDDEAAAIDMVNSWSHCTSTQQSAIPGFNVQGNAQRLMQRMSAINPAQLFYTDFSACNNYQQGEAAAVAINSQQCPTLFVMAKQDRMTPVKASATLRSSILGSKVVEIANCGHSLMTEQPDAVLTALVQFLK